MGYFVYKIKSSWESIWKDKPRNRNLNHTMVNKQMHWFANVEC